MSRRRALWIALPLLAAVVAMAGFAKWRMTTFASEERSVVTATPAVPGFAGILPVELPERGSEVCIDGVTFSPRTRELRIGTVTEGRPGPRTEIVATAPGYRAKATAAGWPANGELIVALDTPERPVIGGLCVRKLGAGPLALVGTQEGRAAARTEVTIDGEPTPADVALTFYSGETKAFSDQLPQILSAISRLSWPGEWLLWILLAVVLVGTPAGALAALGLALRDDTRQERNDRPSGTL